MQLVIGMNQAPILAGMYEVREYCPQIRVVGVVQGFEGTCSALENHARTPVAHSAVAVLCHGAYQSNRGVEYPLGIAALCADTQEPSQRPLTHREPLVP
jgi:hypothetical protein